MESISISELHDKALLPRTWFAWVPETFLTSIPENTRVAISCHDDIWVAVNEQDEVVVSTEDISVQTIESSKSDDATVKRIFAMLTSAVDDSDDVA